MEKLKTSESLESEKVERQDNDREKMRADLSKCRLYSTQSSKEQQRPAYISVPSNVKPKEQKAMPKKMVVVVSFGVA